MSDMIYREIIKDMVWSYSRIECFESCPYRWFMKYISGCEDSDRFYATYGSFMHKILERYLKGEIGKDDMLVEFLTGFSTNVTGPRPSAKIVQNYIQSGANYLKNFQDFPYFAQEVEVKLYFHVDKYPFVGIIDVLGSKDGELYIIDHKSRSLKPRSKRAKPTRKDEELDQMLRQLYLYSGAVKEIYGKFPKGLCFNCFKENVFIEEPFNEETYKKTIEWAVKSIEEIESTEDFYPDIDYFSCGYLCGVSDECIYKEMSR